MTNQETIANLNMISVAFVEPVTKEQRKLIDDTFEMAIQALTAIDDIKAEIEHLTCRQYEYKLMLDREEVFEIIDKYTGKESE